jgi:transcriptional regulator with XRE-family HTH domain
MFVSQSELARRLHVSQSAVAQALKAGRLAYAPGAGKRFELEEALAAWGVAVSNALDTAFAAGTGTDGQPKGIVGSTNVGSVSGTSLSLAALLEFQSNAAEANAVGNPQSFGYFTTPAIAETLAARQKFTGSSTALWEGSTLDGIVCGHRAIGTAAAPTATVIGGDFSQAIVASWPGLLLASDPYTAFRTGVVTLRAMLSVDFIFLRPQAFSVAESVT